MNVRDLYLFLLCALTVLAVVFTVTYLDPTTADRPGVAQLEDEL